MEGFGLPHVPNCFGCSEKNPVGLKLKFTFHDDHICGEFESNANHVGPPDIVHGGVIAAIIDESFSVLCRGVLKKDSRTIKEEVTFRRPAMAGATLKVKTKLEQESSRTLEVSAEVLADDVLIAQGKGTLFKLKPVN